WFNHAMGQCAAGAARRVAGQQRASAGRCGVMMAAQRLPPLVDALPSLQGRVQTDVPLAPFTWFRVGGPAEALVRPADPADLVRFLGSLPHTVPVIAIGAASNLIVRDGGVPGVIIRLGRGFGRITVEQTGIVAGAAALDVAVAEHAAATGLSGLEFLSGIPGS